MAEDRGLKLSPNCVKAPPSLTLLGHSGSTESEEGHSRETVTCTPVLSMCQRELGLGLDIQPKDATTPVLPGQDRLPPPPDSPSIQLTAPPEAASTLIPPVSEPDRFSRRPGSQRVAKKKSQKKNIGIVIGDFSGMLRDELTIKEGEEIEIISKDTIVSRNIGWWTGRNAKGKIGIFPAACVSCDIPNNNGSNRATSTESLYPLEIKNSEVTFKEVVGIGGFGKVFRGIYKGEDVAVKVAKSTTFDSLKAVQDVISEAEKFAHLAHINVCALVGVVLVKDVCLVMEYAPGGALSEVLHKNKTSLSIDVITNWTMQIASGMHYLHHVAEPCLIHRDLKTSNILLSNSVDPSNLKNNTIKITDFGLAREIEHTTHMSGAGTYPWMAPEVIRTSDFSKKSDVWSFAVVVWELVTGERPYGGLNLFVVAYGVGHGTLSLPIPEGCPEPLTDLMEACWRREYAERPSFVEILEDVKKMEESTFCQSTTHAEFQSMQSVWRGEIQRRFVELKKMEHDLQRREQNLLEKISEQEQKKKELEEEKRKVDLQAEEYSRLIALLKDRHLASQEGTDTAQSQHTAQLVRPPRTSTFSFRKYIQKILGSDKPKVNNPLPNRMENARAFRRFTSNPANTTDKRAPITASTDRRHTSPLHHYDKKGHRRRSSDEIGYNRAGDNSVDVVYTNRDTAVRRGSVPTSPNPGRAHHQPIIAQQGQKQAQQQGFSSNSLKKELDKRSNRQRSCSDLRSPSPQALLLPSYLSPSKLGNTSPSPNPFPKGAVKPTHLGLSSVAKLSSHDASSPGSPNVMITPADHPLSQYDSGKDSMTCSDASGHSNCSESQPVNMIELDSPVHASITTKLIPGAADYVSEFDPLIRQSISHDSLFDSKYTTSTSTQAFSTSPTPTPTHNRHHRSSLEGSYEGSSCSSGIWMSSQSSHHSSHQYSSQSSTSPKGDTVSPKQSVSSRDHPSPSIVRPRPKPSKEFTFHTISAPSSRPESPRDRSSSMGCNLPQRASSPTGSVHSMRAFSFDVDPGDYYSDTASTTSSLLELSMEPEDPRTMVDINFNNMMVGFFSNQQQY